MADLSAAIGSILNDPQSMAQLQNVMRSLGLNGSGAPAAPSPAPAPDPVPAAGPAAGALANTDAAALGALMRFAPLLSAAAQEDDAARLLKALRPLLSAERQRKLDEAQKVLRMMRLLPLLRESGLLRGLL